MYNAGDFHQLEPLHSLEEARADWERLSAASVNPFATWDWADAWWRRFGGDGRLWLWRVVDDEGETAAILPLYRRRQGPLDLARFLGHGAADQLGPVCDPARRHVAAAALGDLADQLPPGGLLLAERLAGDEGLATALGPTVRREPSPRLVLGGRSWEEWLSSRSSNFRQQVRRRERRLRRGHRLTLRLADDPTRLDRDLTAMIDLHRARWRRGASTAFSGPREGLHRDFARRALERGWLRLWLAEVDGAPIAAWYGFRYGDVDWYYQAGRDPSWDREAVGFVLLSHTIRTSFEEGALEYRFGLGDEPYKERFSSDDPGLETVVLARSPVRELAAAAAAAGRSLPAGMRRAIVQRAG